MSALSRKERQDPTDRRRVVVEPTDQTARKEVEVFGGLLRASRELATTYTDAELAVINDFLKRSRQVIAAHRASLSRAADGSHAR